MIFSCLFLKTNKQKKPWGRGNGCNKETVKENGWYVDGKIPTFSPTWQPSRLYCNLSQNFMAKHV